MPKLYLGPHNSRTWLGVVIMILVTNPATLTPKFMRVQGKSIQFMLYELETLFGDDK